jgi:hypothetical protein
MVDEQETEQEQRAGSGSGHRWVPGRTVVLTVAFVAIVIGGTGLGLALSDAGASTTSPAACGTSMPRLTVQGTGESSATPDILTAVIAFNDTAPTAGLALSQDNTKVAQAILALAGNGLARKDVQTSNLTIQPQYAYPKGVPTITGYQVTNTITATMHDVKKAGAAIDAVVGLAGNSAQVNSLTFSFSNPAKVESQARGKAVQQAVRHARTMAHAAGRSLGPVCSLTDNTTPPLRNTLFSNGGSVALGSAGPAIAAPAPVPFEAGTTSESDQVTLVYAVAAR